MQHSDLGNPQHFEIQTLYTKYAQAAEKYVKRPTINNWEEKEKAFENYNAFLIDHLNRSKK